MISLKRLLEKVDGENPAPSLLRSSSLLMEAIALHAVQHDAVQYAAFRDAVRLQRLAAEKPESTDQILVATGQVIQLMEAHNREVEAFIRMQTGEFHEMVRMLSRTLIEITRESAHAGENLAKIENDLNGVARLDDLRVIKSKLRDSLQAISSESTRQRETAQRVKAGLQEQLRSMPLDGSGVDGVTGLPDPAEAERAIEEAFGSEIPAYVAVLCMERLNAINASFGYAVGDRLMLKFAQDVAQRLAGDDKLFRWRGPTLLAVLHRATKVHDVRIEASRLIGQRHEQVVRFQERTILLPVAARCTIIPLVETASFHEALDRVNGFVAAAAGI